MGQLFDAGWNRYGWPEEFGGLGGSVIRPGRDVGDTRPLRRARHGGVRTPRGPRTDAVCDGAARLRGATRSPPFSPGGSCGARASPSPTPALTSPACAPRPAPYDGGFVVNGRKIWTSWAKYATLVPGARAYRHARVTTPRPHRSDRGHAERRASNHEPSSRPTAPTNSPRCSSTTCSCRRIASSARSTADGPWPCTSSATSAARSAGSGTASYTNTCATGWPSRVEAHDAATGNALLDLIAVECDRLRRGDGPRHAASSSGRSRPIPS